MSALARYFLHEGQRVAGYDRVRSHLTDQIEAEGAVVHYEEDPALIPADFRDPATTIVVYTPAVPADHTELRWFEEHGFEIVKRSQMLGYLSQGKFVMAVAGTHGKTTTTTLVAWLNHRVTGGGSAFLGGISRNFSSNLVLGRGRRLAVEADEFDRSFLRLWPDVAVVTSADADHLDIYGTHEALREAFSQFVGQIREGGALVVKRGVDLKIGNPGIRVYRYSYDEPCDFYARNVTLLEGGHYRYDLVTPGGVVEGCTLGIPGWVNIENAVAAVAALWCASERDGEPLDAERLREALASFEGVKRRFEFYVNTPRQVYMDDYAHHPRELAAAITSVKEDVSGAAADGAFPAAPLHPHAGFLPRVRRGALACRPGGTAADLSGPRGADSGCGVRDDRPPADGALDDLRPCGVGRKGGCDGYRCSRQLRRGQYRRLLRGTGRKIAGKSLIRRLPGTICFFRGRVRRGRTGGGK